MSNPVLSERAVSRVSSRLGPAVSDAAALGPVSAPRDGGFSVAGAVTTTGVLFVGLVVSAVFGWLVFSAPPVGVVLSGVLLAFACAILVSVRPAWARVLAPIYAVVEGFVLGVVSRVADAEYSGVVLQAVGATIAVFAVMLVLYRSRVIKVTGRFRRVVSLAVFGLMLFYGVALLSYWVFGADVFGFVGAASPLGVLFSVGAAVLAALSLTLDFDLIEHGAAEGWPKEMEWYAAFGLLVTLVWLYLELLHLAVKVMSYD